MTMAGWKISYEWRFYERNITDFYDPFSSQPRLITGGYMEILWTYHGDTMREYHQEDVIWIYESI